MKTLLAIVEDSAGNVIGAQTNEGEIRLPTPLPRSQLAAHARELAAAFGVTLPENPAIPPAE
jgi:hypothetical protein